MDRKESIQAEIDLHLSKIKDLRLELEKEEQELEVCYNVLNIIENENEKSNN